MFQVCTLLVLKVHFYWKRSLHYFNADKICRAKEWTWILRKSRRDITFRCFPVAIRLFCKAETSFLVLQLSLTHIPLTTKRRNQPSWWHFTVLGSIFLPPGLKEVPIWWVICRSVDLFMMRNNKVMKLVLSSGLVYLLHAEILCVFLMCFSQST